MSSLTLSFLFLFLLLLLKLSLQAQAQTNGPKPMNPVSAVFAFGDSTMDPGNNNFIATAFRSDFPPYGRDFFTHLPTGRFTNGKLVTDFAASYVGLKEELPPCLDWSLGIDELMTGVSFASAGSGFDPLTAQIGGVIPMPQQLNYFKDYLNKLDFTIGKEKRADIIKRAIFVVSAGTNDFISYSTLPLRRQSFSIEGYQGYILQNLRVLLQGLCDLGAERIVVAGLPPIGCLPVVITLNSKDGIHDRSCIEPHNAVSYDYNRKLQALLQGYSTLRQVRIIYADIYNPLFELIQSPTKYGKQSKIILGLVSDAPLLLYEVRHLFSKTFPSAIRSPDVQRELFFVCCTCTIGFVCSIAIKIRGSLYDSGKPQGISLQHIDVT